jgi:transposase
MEQIGFEKIPSTNKFEQYSHGDLVLKYKALESEYFHALKEIYRLKNQNMTDTQLQLFLEERVGDLNQDLFGASSEKYKKSEKPKKEPKQRETPRKKPSERYPNLSVREVVIDMSSPSCKACGAEMSDSGMTEDSEQLTVIPKKYEIILQKRKKYRCSCCHGDLQTAPAPVRIMEGSTYSDEMILDVALSKYCDLIPIERYAAMAARAKVKDIPPHSLIECTHYLADFLIRVYLNLKDGVISSKIVQADETPHRMLEGSNKASWYLWGFSTRNVCYFECHGSRSADVASEVLEHALCEVLVSDVYTGYGKSVRDINETRKKSNKPEIKSAYCNVHARRYFFRAKENYPESYFYLDQYVEIYKLEALIKEKPPDQALELRKEMKPLFEAMRDKAMEDLITTPERGKLSKAIKYFLENYEGLTVCLENPEVPLDNNSQERLLRSHVVGRKTWYGTHSERGARTAAILFSVVESCKLNQVNPRDYFPAIIEAIKNKKPIFTPEQFKRDTAQQEPSVPV